MRKNSIITALVSYLEQELEMQVYRGLRFLHEINDFPSLYVHAGTENRTHIGHGEKLCILDCELRVYAFSDTLDTIELLARKIEQAIQNYATDSVEDYRIIELSTDEGLMEPYSLADIKLQILYRIN